MESGKKLILILATSGFSDAKEITDYSVGVLLRDTNNSSCTLISEATNDTAIKFKYIVLVDSTYIVVHLPAPGKAGKALRRAPPETVAAKAAE
jgi:hypothetical protein